MCNYQDSVSELWLTSASPCESEGIFALGEEKRETAVFTLTCAVFKTLFCADGNNKKAIFALADRVAESSKDIDVSAICPWAPLFNHLVAVNPDNEKATPDEVVRGFTYLKTKGGNDNDAPVAKNSITAPMLGWLGTPVGLSIMKDISALVYKFENDRQLKAKLGPLKERVDGLPMLDVSKCISWTGAVKTHIAKVKVLSNQYHYILSNTSAQFRQRDSDVQHCGNAFVAMFANFDAATARNFFTAVIEAVGAILDVGVGNLMERAYQS